MSDIKSKPTVLVARIDGVEDGGKEYSSTFQMDVSHSLANNKEFWKTQVDEFVAAAERGNARLLLSTNPKETWVATRNPDVTPKNTTSITSSKPTNQTVQNPIGPKKMTDNTIRSGAVKSEAFKILSGAPVPTPARGRRKQPVSEVYPFKDMGVGDMFSVAGKTNIQKARNAAQQFVKEQGPKWKFITRDVSNTNNGQGGVYPPETYGIWRVVPQVAVHSPAHQAVVTGDQDEPHHNSNAPDVVSDDVTDIVNQFDEAHS